MIDKIFHGLLMFTASYIAFSLQPQMNPLLDESSEGRIDVNLTGFPRGGIDVINGLNIFFIYEGISAGNPA